MDNAAVGRRIGELRRAKNLSHAALGAAAGVAKQTVINVEFARHSPRTDVLEAIATALGVTMSELLAGPTEVIRPKRTPRRQPRPSTSGKGVGRA